MHLTLTNNFFRCLALHRSNIFVEPNDGAGRTTLRRHVGERAFAIVDHGQAINHFDLVWRVHGASPARGTGHLAIVQNGVALG